MARQSICHDDLHDIGPPSRLDRREPGGNPLLRMCFGNVVAETDPAENEKFTKAPGKTRGRIDGTVATRLREVARSPLKPNII